MILVFSNNSKEDFDALAAVHSAAENDNQCGDLLRLCLGISNNNNSQQLLTGKAYEAEYSRRILWCLDHGYEYIEGVRLDGDAIFQGHNTRDKDGFARVVEANFGSVQQAIGFL